MKQAHLSIQTGRVGFLHFLPHMDLPGWVGNWCSCLPCRSHSSFSAAPLPAESGASDTLSSPWCGRAPPPAENSTNTVTIWALFGVVVPLLQLKTQHKKMMVPLAKLNTHCTNTVTLQVLQKPGSLWSNHATPPPLARPTLFLKYTPLSKPRWLRIQHGDLDQTSKKKRKKKVQDTDDTERGTKFSLFVCRWWRLLSRSAGQHGNHRDKSVSWPPGGSSWPPWGCLAQNTWQEKWTVSTLHQPSGLKTLRINTQGRELAKGHWQQNQRCTGYTDLQPCMYSTTETDGQCFNTHLKLKCIRQQKYC